MVVMGGPHVTFRVEEALDHCDYVVLGEGEATFSALVAALADGRSPQGIPGLGFRLSSGEVHRSAPPPSVDYAQLPSPDFSLCPHMEKPPPIVVTSRGCPNNCTFCTVRAMFGGQYRFKKNTQVIAELHPILDKSVFFGDDNFCAVPERTNQLLKEMMAHEAVPLRWSTQICVDDASDSRVLDLMQRTRCCLVYVGIESIDPSTLRKFRKTHNVDSIGRCIENLHKHNIDVHGMFVVHPDDVPADIDRMAEFAIEASLDRFQICVLTPFPGTHAYEEWQSRIMHHDWQYYDGLHVVVRPSRCSAYEMQMAAYRAMERFYSPKRVVESHRRNRFWRLKDSVLASMLLPK